MEEICFSEIAKLSVTAATLHFCLSFFLSFFFFFFFVPPGKSLSAPGQAKDKAPNKESHSTMTTMALCEQRHRLFPLPDPARVTVSEAAGVRVLSLKLEEF